MAALIIGLSIGFAGGYGVGTTRGHSQASTQPDASPSQIAAAAAPPAPPSRDTTEVPLMQSPPLTATPPPSAPPAATAQPRPAKSPERQTRQQPQPRPPARAPERTASPAATGTSGTLVGRLSVDSRPAGARVFLDNKPIGVTPLAMPSIKAGEHAIRLEREGYRRWTSSVRIVAGEQNRVTASLDR